MPKLDEDLPDTNGDMGEDVEQALEEAPEEEAIQSCTAIRYSDIFANSFRVTDSLETLFTGLKVQNDDDSETEISEVSTVDEESDEDKPTNQTVGNNPAKMKTTYGRRDEFIGLIDRHLRLSTELKNLSKVPRYIFEAMRDDEVNELLQICNEDLHSASGYKMRFRMLLWLEEAQQAVEMRRYDLFNVALKPIKDSLFSVKVPGLAQGRPSLMQGDKLLLKSECSNYEASIREVRENDILIKPYASFNSSAGDNQRFNISFFPSRTTFLRGHQAIDQFEEAIAFPIPKQESPEVKIEVNEETDNFCWFKEGMNIHQKQAVLNILKAQCRPAPYIIFGPPGTGKTVTMIEAILQIYARLEGSKILVCANSNACVDMIATRIKQSEKVPLDEMVRVSAFYRMDKLIPPELVGVTKSMNMILSGMYNDYRVVITTCIQSGALRDLYQKFDYVFIDEAGHANEPEALIPASLLEEDGCFVLAGDPHQLGPVCISPVTGDHGLGTSLLERLCGRTVYERQNKNSKMVYDDKYITKLLISYRSDPRVMAINNAIFYHNELEFKNETPELYINLLKTSYPLVFHGVGGKDLRAQTSPSWYNQLEALTCIDYVIRLYNAGLKPDQLGIITPYRGQIEKINLLFEGRKLKKCMIATMEKFQGDEREVIIISTVRTCGKNLEHDRKFNLGFLFNPKRFNVAISRAKWIVIVLGNPTMLKRDPCWAEFLKTAHTLD